MKIKIKTGFFNSCDCNMFIEKDGFRLTDGKEKEMFISFSSLSQLYMIEGGGQPLRFFVVLDKISYEGTFEDAKEAHYVAWELCRRLNARINVEMELDH